MSAENIIILVGAILVVLAIIDSIKINESSLGLIDAKVRIPLGAVGICLLIYGGFSYGAINLQGQIEQPVVEDKIQVTYPIQEVQVLSPIAGASVSCRILTMGVYPDTHQKDIWVVLHPTDNRYYPQSDHTNTSYKRNGEWQVITRFGGDKDESYDIIVYETDPSASQFFSNTIEQWKAMESYPGLELDDIPAGATKVDQIVVSLEENCRGVF